MTCAEGPSLELPNMFTDMPRETDVVQHQIKLSDDTPIRCKPNPLPYAMREELRNEVGPSTSLYASPINMVKKKDSYNRVCVNFQKLNEITKVIMNPSSTKGYWQIPVAPEDMHKTAFLTSNGQFKFRRMLFGMVNSGATQVRGLMKILEGMPGSYIDDIVMYIVTAGRIILER